MPGAKRGWRMHHIVERIGLRCVCEAQSGQLSPQLAAPDPTSQLRASPAGLVGCSTARQQHEVRSIEQVVPAHCIPLAQLPPLGGRSAPPPHARFLRTAAVWLDLRLHTLQILCSGAMIGCY